MGDEPGVEVGGSAGRRSHDRCRHLGGQDRLTCRHRADRLAQRLRLDVLEDIPRGTGTQGLDDRLVLVEGREDEDGHIGESGVLRDELSGGDAVDTRHLQVHEHDVGTLFPDAGERRPTPRLPLGG